MPQDFRIRYEWQAGSLPPPYHYEYTIQIGPAPEGEVEFRPDYSFNDPPVWTERFDVAEQDLTRLHELMADKGIFSKRWQPSEQVLVGGGAQWAEISANGKQYIIPSQLDPELTEKMGEMYEAIRALVPEATWKKLKVKHKDYEREYLEKRH